MSVHDQNERQFQLQNMLFPVIIMLVLWKIGFTHWEISGDSLTFLLLGYIGLFIGAGLGLYLALPQVKRPMGRRLMTFLLGSLLLVTALFSNHGNMQIEGLFFGILVGFVPYIMLHFALAKIFGPLIFGRVWCGWACWFGMIFDLLPYPYSRYRIPGKWGWLRYIHFIVSLGMVLILWFGFGYQDGATGLGGLTWFIIGLLLYYALGISMAFVLKDNRAFCKYLCPLAVPLKIGAQFSLLKVAGDAPRCDPECQACIEMCPMNIRVRDYILNGERVLSTECTLCQTCINVCPHDALKLSFGLDVGRKELIDYVPPKPPRIPHRVES